MGTCERMSGGVRRRGRLLACDRARAPRRRAGARDDRRARARRASRSRSSPLKTSAATSARAATRSPTSSRRPRPVRALPRRRPRRVHRGRADAPASPPTTIDFVDWATIGAQALVKGTHRAATATGVIVEARLFDVAEAHADRRASATAAGATTCRAWRTASPTRSSRSSPASAGRSTRRSRSRRAASGRFKDVYAMSFDGDDSGAVTASARSRSRRAGARTAARCSSRRTAPATRASSRSTSAATKRLRLVRGRGLNLGGRWSPDGRAIAVALEKRRHHRHLAPRPQRPGHARRHRATAASTSRRRGRPTAADRVLLGSRRRAADLRDERSTAATPRRVTFEGNYNTSPAWSPKGDRIAYARRVGGRFQIVGRRRRRRRDAGDDHARRQRGSVVGARRPLPRLLLDARRKRRDLLLRCERNDAKQLTPSGGDDTSRVVARLE